MRQRDSDALCRAKAERFSGCHFNFTIQSLENPRRDGAVSSGPVEDQMPMTPQALGHPLHRFEPAPHGLGTPGVEELAGPRQTHVIPELLKQLSEHLCPDALGVEAEELPQPDLLVLGEFLRSLEQAPTRGTALN